MEYLVEEATVDFFKRKQPLTAQKIDFSSLEDVSPPLPRLLTGIEEFDRVCGGGLVPGSVLLVGGDPGIGKSTLMLQVAAVISHRAACAYISGEEAADQVRLRAKRLHVSSSPVHLATTTQIGDILEIPPPRSHVWPLLIPFKPCMWKRLMQPQGVFHRSKPVPMN